MIEDRDEAALIRSAAAGDPVAFTTLVGRHASAVVSLAATRLRDRTRADDVAQDVFVQLHRSLSRFRQESSLRTWLVRVTLNRCIDVERQRQRASRRETPADLARDAVDPRASAEAMTAALDEARRLRAAIAELPDDLRTLVALRYDAELEYSAIAALLALPMGTVATRLARALRLLRTSLGPRP